MRYGWEFRRRGRFGAPNYESELRYGHDFAAGRGWGRGPRYDRGLGGRGYGLPFRQGYDLEGGFGYAAERGRGRETPAWSGPLRVSRRFGRGYGRG